MKSVGFQALFDKKLGPKLGLFFAKKIVLFSQNIRAKIRIFNAVFKQNSAYHHDFSNLKAFHKLLICTDEVMGEICTDVI